MCFVSLRKFSIMRLIKRQQKSSMTTQSLCDHPISLVIIIVVIIILLVGKNQLRKWKLGGLSSVTFFLLVDFYQRILLVISNQVNHCDLSTVKDMWVITRTLGFIASWLTKVFSKLSKGNLLLGRVWIFSQTLKHSGVFKLLLAS